MHNDDHVTGRLLSRREAVRLMGAAGAGLLVTRSGSAADTSALRSRRPAGDGSIAASFPTCVAKPELIEGPYFLDAQLDRSDIRAEPSTGVVRPGVALGLTFTISDVAGGNCSALEGALVDVWQCDAGGAYSGFTDERQGFRTEGERWLRGQQMTDDKGTARFTTIYPGWYAGRAVHIHFKIRTGAAGSGTYEFTSQLFFDEALTDQVHALPPYAQQGRRDTMNSEDGIYRRGGNQLLLTPVRSGEGYEATFAIGLDLSDSAVGRRDGRRRGLEE